MALSQNMRRLALLPLLLLHGSAWMMPATRLLRRVRTLGAHQVAEEESNDDDGGDGGFTKLVFAVAPQDAGARLDRFLADRVPDQSRSYLGSLCAQGHVSRQQGQQGQQFLTKKSQKLKSGDLVEVTFAATSELEVVPEDIPLEVLYEDDDVIAVNKAVGMVVHPAPGNWNGTLVNALAHRLGSSNNGSGGAFGGGGSSLRPGIVHRLDKGTSGVIIAAKHAEAQAKLSDCFKERRVGKTYLAVCVGEIPAESSTAASSPSASSSPRPLVSPTGLDAPRANPLIAGELLVDEPIGRHPEKRQRMAVVPESRGGRSARSRVSTIGFNGQLSLCRVAIETGRTHQIRVHLAHLNRPILGDETYGFKDWNQRAAQKQQKKKKTQPPTAATTAAAAAAAGGNTGGGGGGGGAPEPVRGVERPLLHAAALSIPHPSDEARTLRIVCPPPTDFAAAAESILGRPLDMADHFPPSSLGAADAAEDEAATAAAFTTAATAAAAANNNSNSHNNGVSDGGDDDSGEGERTPQLADGKLLAQAEAEGWY
jgi:23S rRNA pseudouridine1911/1915/1917 synthase